MRPLSPMLASAAAALPQGADWTYEVKWDGYRTVAVKDEHGVTLWSRRLKNATTAYPTIAHAVARTRAAAAMIDGEIVAIDERGRPSFQALHHQDAHTLAFYAFDLLHLDGEDLTGRPLRQRRAALATIVAGSGVLLSEPLPGTPAEIEYAVRELQLEGIVAKLARSRYEPGRRSPSWVKVKFNRRQEFVVGGLKPGGSSFESLLVGYYRGRKLYYAGKVRAGLTPLVRRDIVERVTGLEAARCPFVNLPNSGTSHWGEGITPEDMKALVWVRPRLVVEVSFVEWTRDGALRHPQFVGIRDDKAPTDVTRE